MKLNAKTLKRLRRVVREQAEAADLPVRAMERGYNRQIQNREDTQRGLFRGMKKAMKRGIGPAPTDLKED